MSYIPYSPATLSPSSRESTVPERRPWQWYFWRVCLALLLLGPPAVYYTWRFMPKSVAPPIATIPLFDGTELRLVQSLKSLDFRFSSNDDFDGRVLFDRPPYSSSSGTYRHGTGATTWLVFTAYDPRRKQFQPPAFQSFEVVEEDGPLRFKGALLIGEIASSSVGYDMPPVNAVAFDSIPRRPARLKLRFSTGGAPVEATIANPFHHPDAPRFTAEPLPARKEVDGVVFELLKVSVSPSARSGAPSKYSELNATVTAKMPGFEKYGFSVQKEFFDPTGNLLQQGILPTGDRVWGLRVTATEPHNFPFPPERRAPLAKMPVPAPGQAVKLPVTEAMRKTGIREMVVLGHGNFSAHHGRLSGRAPDAVKETSAVTIVHRPSRTWSSRNLSVVFFGLDGRPLEDTGAQLRLYCAGELMTSQTSSYSSANREYAQFYGSYVAGKRAPAPGEDLEVALIFPKTHTAEFYFERPKLPGE